MQACRATPATCAAGAGEIEVATADATCYGEAGLAPLFDAARTRAQAAVEGA
jgi:hypothetical protein